MKTEVETVRLVPGRWVRLPGTTVEIRLHGKHRMAGDGVEITRTGSDPRFGCWDLVPLHGLCHARAAPMGQG